MNQSQESSHKIVEASRIISLLKRLMKEQVPLTATSEETRKEWYGTISEMQFHEGRLILSELENVGSNSNVMSEGMHEFYAKLAGVAIRFDAEILPDEEDSDNNTCRIGYPKVITYHQRRISERIGIWVDQKIPVIISMEGDATIKGHLRDISVDGMNACFYRILPIAPNEVFPSVRIQLPNGETAESKLEVRGVTVNENIGQLQLRGRFIDIAYDERKKLQSFVRELEQSLGEPS